MSRSFLIAWLMPIHVKNGTRKSIATIGMLSGADEMVQSWCQSETLIAHSATSKTARTNMVHLLISLRISVLLCGPLRVFASPRLTAFYRRDAEIRGGTQS